MNRGEKIGRLVLKSPEQERVWLYIVICKLLFLASYLTADNEISVRNLVDDDRPGDRVEDAHIDNHNHGNRSHDASHHRIHSHSHNPHTGSIRTTSSQRQAESRRKTVFYSYDHFLSLIFIYLDGVSGHFIHIKKELRE